MSDPTDLQKVPEEMYEVADDRTRPIRKRYMSVIAGQHHVTREMKPQWTLMDLCCACYLQGVVDSGKAFAQNDPDND